MQRCRHSAAIEPAAVSLAVIYVMVWGFLHLKGSLQEPVLTGALRIVRLVVVLGEGLRLWEYNAVLVDTFMECAGGLAARSGRGGRSGCHRRCVVGARADWWRRTLSGQGRRAQRRRRLLPRCRGRVSADGYGVRVHAVSDGAGARGARAAARGRAGVRRACCCSRATQRFFEHVGRAARELRAWSVCSRS